MEEHNSASFDASVNTSLIWGLYSKNSWKMLDSLRLLSFPIAEQMQ